jgi:hypothetical protein
VCIFGIWVSGPPLDYFTLMWCQLACRHVWLLCQRFFAKKKNPNSAF